MSEIDGIVKLKEEGREMVVIITSKGARKQTYQLDGAVLDPDIKTGGRVKEGAALFVNVDAEKIVAPFGGAVIIKDNTLTLRGREKDVREYRVPVMTSLEVQDGDTVSAGQQITEGHLNVQKLFERAGVRSVQRYILREVQQVYAIQGETINDKHLEIVVRQMLSRVRVRDAGDTMLPPGRVIELQLFQQENKKAEEAGKKPAIGERLLMGITKVSLTTSSFLAAASFMETARTLIDAAVTGREDYLEGLKENVIIGRLIPVGTGYRDETRLVKESREAAAVENSDAPEPEVEPQPEEQKA